MKKIEFTTARGTGYVEIPDDVTSIRVPEGICSNCGEPETLEHGAVGAYQGEPEDDSHKITLPGGEEDTEHLLPNIE